MTPDERTVAVMTKKLARLAPEDLHAFEVLMDMVIKTRFDESQARIKAAAKTSRAWLNVTRGA